VDTSFGEILSSTPGLVTLGGIVVCLAGIGIAALAGLTKEREMPEAEKKKAIAEFSFTRGIVVATFSGIMSACFAFALTAGKPINAASQAAGTNPFWAGLPRLIVVLLGGFTTNFVWCLILNVKNATGYQYFQSQIRPQHLPSQPANETATSDLGGAGAIVQSRVVAGVRTEHFPMMRNYFFSALAGTTWYFQFFFYTMGESQMGKFGFASWTLHMASIIIFSTMWGWIFHEWKGSSRKAHTLIATGIATLIFSTVIVGFGTWLKGHLAGTQ
jgi:L-rhamnose-H+ transport protein